MKGKAMAIIDKMAVCVFAAMITCALAAGECVLFDGTNYPWLPQAFKGAEVGDYAKTRTLDVAFGEKSGSGAQIRCLRGDVQADMREWLAAGSTLEIEFAKDGTVPKKLSVEVLAIDPREKPAVKKFARGECAADAVAKKGDGLVARVRLSADDGLDENFVPTTLKITASGAGRMSISRVAAVGPKVSPSSLPAPRAADESHLWLRVKGRAIVTSPKAAGGERPFVPAGVGYGKDVILHGHDEEVARFVKQMGLNTIRLAFYNLNFNSRPAEPLEFRDVVAFIDPVVAAARRHGLYVILDDHAYFKNEIDESTARGEQKSAGWTTERFERWVAAWGRVAERYRDEPYILGYELCNEPVCEPLVARKWYRRAIAEIRKFDKRHIVIVGTHHWSHSRAMAATWEGVADKIDAPYGNVVFSFHDYPLDDPPEKVAKSLAAFQDRYGVPVMCTEFGGGGTPERVHRETQAGMLALFAREGIGWMLWTLEDRHGAGQPFPTRAKKVEKSWEIVEQKPPRYWIPFPEIWGPVARIVASPFPTRAE